MRKFNKKQKIVAAAGVLGLGVLLVGGNKVYQSFSSDVFPKPYNAVKVVGDTSGKEGYVLVDSIVKFSVVNPFIVQGSDDNYYLYGSNINNNNIQSNATDNKISFYVSGYNVSDTDYKNHEMTWDKISTQTISGLPTNTTKPLSPKIYRIGDYYYMIFTLITKNSEESYDSYSSNTTSSVYYAISPTLTQNTEWIFKGEVPYGRDYFLNNIDNYKTGDTESKNLNHNAGSFLVEDSNDSLEFDDNDNIYFYYHVEGEVNGNGSQASYGIKLKATEGVLSEVSNEPSLILSTESANADIVTDPYVIKDGSNYRIYYSTERNNDLYTYNIDSALGSEPLGSYAIDNREILSDRYAGGLSVYQIYIKDDITKKLYSDNYYVFHRTKDDDQLPQVSNAASYIRKDIKKSVKNEYNGTSNIAIMPRFSGTKDLATSTSTITTYRNTIAKEKYNINGKEGILFNGVTVAKGNTLGIELNDRQDVREILLYTDLASNVTSLNVTFDVNTQNDDYNMYSSTPTLQYRSYNSDGKALSYATVAVKDGVVRLILPYDIKTSVGGTSVSSKVDNILIGFTTSINKIYDIELVSLTTPNNQDNVTKDDIYQYSNYHFINYDVNKETGIVNPADVENQCKSKILKSTDIYNDKCVVTQKYYNYDYDFVDNKPDHYGELLYDDYDFVYRFSPTEYIIKYYLEAAAEESSNEIKFAIKSTAAASEYKEVVLDTPEKTGYTFKGWKDRETGNIITTANINAGGNYMKDYELVAQWQANSIVIKYNKGTTETTGTSWGTTSIKTVNSTYDAQFNHPDLIWTGHNFLGWFDSEGHEVKNGEVIKSTESTIVLTAGWEDSFYKLSLVTNGGVIDCSFLGPDCDPVIENLKYNDEYYSLLPIPNRLGYVFDGWYTSSTGGTKITSTSKFPAADTTIYAHWTGDNVIITFDVNHDNIEPTTATKKVGLAYGKSSTGTTAALPAPTRTGYDFDGWYLGDDESAVKIDNNTVIEEFHNHTLKAHWTAKKFEVTLNLNDGTGSTKATINNNKKTVVYDTQYGELEEPTRYGYTFAGWYKEAACINEVNSSDIVKITANQTLYAKWIPKKVNVNVNYNKGGSVGDPIQLEFDKAYDKTLITVTPTRTDYTFNGWYVNNNGTETKITLGTTKVLIEEEHEIYAKWTGNKIVVTYNGNGGKFGNNTTKAVDNYYSNNYILPSTDPVRAGYTLKGWYTTETGGVEITEESIVERTTAQTLYAHWDVAKYTVTYNSVGGSNVDNKEFEYNAKLGELPTPTRVGYTLEGWYTTETYTSTTKVTADTAVTKDVTLYAKWVPVKVNISFNSNGGSSVTNISKDYGTAYGTLSTPTKTGYVFAGWYKEDTLTNKVESTTEITNTSDHTLYAKWTPNTYTLKLNLNGGTATISEYQLIYNEDYPEINEPTKEGYKFKGWYSTATGGTKYEVTGKVNLTSANGSTITVYAQYEAITVSVSYDANGGSTVDKVDTVAYNAKYSTLPTTTRNGYTFDGWYDAKEGGNKITAGSTVMNKEENHTLYAHWLGKAYTVTFNKNGGTITGTSITVNYGAKYSKLPETGTKKGYVFAGWKDEEGNVITNDTIYNVNANQTIFAQWNLEEYIVTYGEKTNTYTIETADFVLEQPDAKEGKEFLGYTGNGITTPTKTITIKKGTTGNLTYNANWKDIVTGEAVIITQVPTKKGQSVSEYISKNSKYKKLLNQDRSVKNSTDLIKTGDIAIDSSNNETVIVVAMDVDGDGKIGTGDVVRLWNHIDKTNPNKIDGEVNKYFRMAADVTSDNVINTQDYVKIWNYVKKQ